MTEKERHQLIDEELIDVEDTIRRLTNIVNTTTCCGDRAPLLYMPQNDIVAISNAVELLRKQKPKLVVKDRYKFPYCPHCSTKESREELLDMLHPKMNYCPYCGQRLLFDTRDDL